MSRSLFQEMDAIADAVRRNNPELREDLSDELQIEFRQLQKRRMPELAKEEWLELFCDWSHAYIGRLQKEYDTVMTRDLAIVQRRAREHPSPPLVCPCGATFLRPFNEEEAAIHGPHFAAAGEARRRARGS